MDKHNRADKRGWIGNLAFLGFALVAGFFLFTEHRAHVYGALPYLLFLLCPLMHLFHHGGHGQRHGGSGGDGAGKRADSVSET